MEKESLLLNALMEDTPTNEMVNLCAGIIGNPLCFSFFRGEKGVMLSDQYPPDDALTLIISQRFSGLQAMAAASDQDFARLPSPAFFIYNSGEFSIARHLLCSVDYGGRQVGFLCLPETSTPLEELDTDLTVRCAHVLAISLILAGRGLEQRRIREAMSMLVNAIKPSYADISEKAGYNTLPEKGDYYLLALRLINEENASVHNMKIITEHLAQHFSTQWVYRSQRAIVLLLQGTSPSRETLTFLEHFLSVAGCAACYSPCFHHLLQAPVWHKRLQFLPAFRRAAAGACFDYGQYLDWGLMGETGLSDQELTAFIPEPLLALRRYDGEHGTEYLRTLIAYLDNGCSQKKTAEALSAHINTVNYRMQRMGEQFGIHLDAPGALFQVTHAIRLMQYLNFI